MAGLNVGDIVSVTYWGTLFAQRVMNVLHYRISVDSTAATYEEAAEDLAFSMISGASSPGLAMLDAQGAEYTCNEVRVQKVNGLRERYVPYLANLSGVHAGACTTPNVSAVIIKRSASVSRRGLGTFHLPGIPETGYVNGALTAGYTTLMNLIAARLLNPVTVVLETTVANPVLWTIGSDPVYYPLVTATTVPTLRIMRRRTVGLGI